MISVIGVISYILVTVMVLKLNTIKNFRRKRRWMLLIEIVVMGTFIASTYMLFSKNYISRYMYVEDLELLALFILSTLLIPYTWLLIIKTTRE